MQTISYIIDEETKNKIINFYIDYQQENRGEYIIFFAKYEKTSITIYESKKGFKVLFSGNNALEEAKIFNPNAQISISKPKEKIIFETFENQIGSDEVGFGDFFGPLVVVASYYSTDLKELTQIKDSKQLTDEFILSFIPTIINKITFSKLTVHNDKYNELINKGYNMNKIKALLHNQALLNLKKKVPNCTNCFIDQFCEINTYFTYLKNEKEIVKNITFSTKGEQHFPSVALSSMIARYCFLKEMKVLNDKYGLNFPKGASKKVDDFTLEFINKYSINELNKVCKTNFINYKKITKKND